MLSVYCGSCESTVRRGSRETPSRRLSQKRSGVGRDVGKLEAPLGREKVNRGGRFGKVWQFLKKLNTKHDS